MPMMWGYGYTWSWGAALLMIANMVFWVGLLALAIWAVARWFSGRGGDTGRFGDSPREVLDRRYANGEIDEETYGRMLARLEGRTPINAGPPAATR